MSYVNYDRDWVELGRGVTYIEAWTNTPADRWPDIVQTSPPLTPREVAAARRESDRYTFGDALASITGHTAADEKASIKLLKNEFKARRLREQMGDDAAAMEDELDAMAMGDDVDAAVAKMDGRRNSTRKIRRMLREMDGDA